MMVCGEMWQHCFGIASLRGWWRRSTNADRASGVSASGGVLWLVGTRVAVCSYLLAGVCCAHAFDQSHRNCHGPSALEEAVQAHPSAENWEALGGWFGERRQYDCAIPAFQAAVRANPGSASDHYYLGLAQQVTGQPAAAVAELQRSIELDPSKLQPRLVLGLALNTLGHRVEAEEAWEGALRIDPNSLVALDWLAKARISSGQLDAAVDLLRSAPRDETLTLDLALAYSQSHQLGQAVNTLKSALLKRPGNPRLSAALATIYIQSHRYQDASDLLVKAAQSGPRDSALQLLYLRVLVLQDDEATAKPLVRTFLSAHPHDFDALYLAGVVDDKTQQYSQAVEHLSAAVILNPNHYDSRFNLGDALFHLGQNAAALKELEKAVALDPSEAQGHFRLAQVLRALGEPDAAQEQLKLFKECQQNTVNLALAQTKAGQATLALKNGKADEAAALYREAIKVQPQNASFYFDLAMALDHKGLPEDRTEERNALEKAITLRPGFALAENQLGLMAVQDGDVAAAESHFRSALAASPLYADAANNLGTLLGGENREVEAESYFRLAVASDPYMVSCRVNLAATLASQSRFAEARSTVKSALKIDPHDPNAIRLLQLLDSRARRTNLTPAQKTTGDVAADQRHK